MNPFASLRKILDESSDRRNPDPLQLQELLERTKTVAVVGISRDPQKPARRIPAYLAAQGFEIIPVTPATDRILGKETRATLAEVTEPVDMVLVFRPSQEAALVAQAAMARPERPVIWLQEGIRADEIAEMARSQGITVVQDLCIYRVHQALGHK